MNLSTSLASSTASTPAKSVIEVKCGKNVDKVHSTISVVVDSENFTKSQHKMVLKAVDDLKVDDDETTNPGTGSIKLKIFREDSGDSPAETADVITADPTKLNSAKAYNRKSEETKDDSVAQIKNVEIESQMRGVIVSTSGTTIYLETPIADEQQHRVHHKQISNKTNSSAKMGESTAKPKCLSNEFLISTAEADEFAETLKSPGESSVEVATHSGIEKYITQHFKNTEDDFQGKLQKENMSFCIKEVDINNSAPKNQVSTADADVPSSSYASYPLVTADTQSMDLIERRDFENEQRLTGGILLKTGSLINKNMLNLVDACNQQNQTQLQTDENPSSCGRRLVYSDSKCDYKNSLVTPTSSRAYNSRLIKSPAKINICPTLSYSQSKQKVGSARASNANVLFNETSPSVIVEASTSSNFSGSVLATTILYSNSNSNDSMTSERGYVNVTSSKSINDSLNICDQENQQQVEKPTKSFCRPISALKSVETDAVDEDAQPSTSSARCQYAPGLKNMRQVNASAQTNEKYLSRAPSCSTSTSILSVGNNLDVNKLCRKELTPHFNRNSASEEAYASFKEIVAEVSVASITKEREEFREDQWADCEENSDSEEICTCHRSSSGSSHGGSNCSLNETEDLEFIANVKDNEFSNFQKVSVIENVITSHSHVASPNHVVFSNQKQRKRKYNDSRVLVDGECDSGNINIESDISRKRIAYDFSGTPRSTQISNALMLSSVIATSSVLATGSPNNRRTPRSIIPTRENPPPELEDWLSQFQRWSHAERLLAVDRLIEHCEPTQVRHMMKVIEPQFQRDFISLLPRELALQVLAYLDPMDLLRAAQTCRSWRFLCDDNLLWKEKCRTSQILTELRSDRPRRGRAGNMPHIASPWKAAYMRQHIIEMNWRSRVIRDPKVLKGHDDHVITCLQFSGNRIVSGSDDNTLKVWSAVTGKCLRTLVGHTGGVWSSQMSGNTIISGSTDRTLKVWDMETGQCVHTLLGHTSTVRCMHLHGKRVVSGSRDATLRVWDIEQGTCLHVLVGHLAAVRCVQYDGKLIVSGAYDYMVKIWHPERQECLHTLQGHTNRVYSLQFDGIHVVSGSLDTSIRVWDVETGNCKHTLMGHQSLTSGMELRQNILVSGNADSTVKVWDITTGQCLQTLSGPNKHQSAVTCLQFNSRFVVTSSDDGTVKLWDVKTGEFIRNLVALDSGGSGGVVWRIRANDTKLICAVGSRNGTEETKLMVLDFDVEGACVKCS